MGYDLGKIIKHNHERLHNKNGTSHNRAHGRVA